METVKTSVIAKSWNWGGINKVIENFQDSENTVYDTISIMLDT